MNIEEQILMQHMEIVRRLTRLEDKADKIMTILLKQYQPEKVRTPEEWKLDKMKPCQNWWSQPMSQPEMSAEEIAEKIRKMQESMRVEPIPY